MVRKLLPILIGLILLSILPQNGELQELPSTRMADGEENLDDLDHDGVNNSEDAYPDAASVQTAIDVLRARGAEEYENNETMAWQLAAQLWSDEDGDGWADQVAPALTDHCPKFPGGSYRIRQGCGDIDSDGLPDELDPDADGDGISNDLELAASTATRQYSIYDPNSVPVDRDYDGIPDDPIDLDDDNDGWSDVEELERGSDSLDAQSTPFNLYFGVTTGTFYVSGEGFTTEPGEGVEISLSWLLTALSTELIIPIGLIPLYLILWSNRRRKFNNYERRIHETESLEELRKLETEVNDLVKDKKIETYQGLVLRNSIEVREVELGADDPPRSGGEEE